MRIWVDIDSGTWGTGEIRVKDFGDDSWDAEQTADVLGDMTDSEIVEWATKWGEVL